MRCARGPAACASGEAQVLFGRLRRAPTSVASVFILTAVLAGQSGSSTIAGLVSDAPGASIPGVSIGVVNEETGVSAETVTTAEGAYRVSARVPGVYRIEMALAGFAPATRRAIRLEVGQTLAADVMLDVEKQTEAVNVFAGVPVIESQAHYTRSSYRDDAESANEYGNTGGYMDAYHRSLDWPASASDVPHHVLASVLYEVQPFTGHRLVDAVFSQWRIGVVETLQPGPPFTVLTTANTTSAFPAGALRPNLSGDPLLPADGRTLTHWLNTAAFANPVPFTFGTAPRSVLRGPGLATTDLTLERRLALTARVNADLRAEAYNLLNRANDNPPGFTLGATDFGVISSARPARILQLGARLTC